MLTTEAIVIVASSSKLHSAAYLKLKAIAMDVTARMFVVAVSPLAGSERKLTLFMGFMRFWMMSEFEETQVSEAI